MKHIMMLIYISLLVISLYFSIINEYDRACFDLLIAYGVRWKVRDEYGE